MKAERFVIVVLAVALFASLASSSGQAPTRRYIGEVRASETEKLPFSEGVLVGDTLYVSGNLGLDPQTGQAPAELGDEIRLLLDSVEKTLAEAGMTMDDLVNVQVFCTDLTLYDTFNQAYRKRFKKSVPARMFVGAGSLLRGAHFEVNGIAVRR